MSKQKFGLGKGLGALIPPAPSEPSEPVSVTPSPETRDDGMSHDIFAHIELARIRPNPYQPRTDFEPQALRELAQSIRENGLVQAITVRRADDGYELISGERRVRACQEAGLTHVPAYIRAVETAEEMIELALIENIQRETLNPIEIAESYRRLVEECGHTQELVAQKVGKNRSTVTNFLRLLKLPEDVRRSIQRQEISMGHARALLALDREGDQVRLWKKIVREDLSVRRVEQLAREGMRPQKPAKLPGTDTSRVDAGTADLVAKLRPVFGTKVAITAGKDGKGAITIEFYNHDDFDRIIELLLSAGK